MHEGSTLMHLPGQPNQFVGVLLRGTASICKGQVLGVKLRLPRQRPAVRRGGLERD
jgi:hypothetical protein